MTYEAVAYWRERGLDYLEKFQHERYAEQEQVLFDYLRGLDFETVLEVGCGFGRIGSRLNAASYTGIDLSPTMLKAARDRIPDGNLIETSLEDFKPNTKYDLVLAVEVLMHIPPDGIAKAVRKLDRMSARHIVTLDWTTPLPRMKTAEHNFLHDYPLLLGTGPFGRPRSVRAVPIGLQTLFHVEKP